MNNWKIIAPLCKPFRQLSLATVDNALCWPKPVYGPMSVHRSNFLNGMRIACAKPLGAQISACTIMFQAGSRLEYDDEIGATHFIRASTVISSCGYSGFMKMRYLPQYGGFMTCSSDRQSISFTLCCPLPVFNQLKWFLIDSAVRCCFLDHELDQKVRPRVEEDLELRQPEIHVMDLIQKACWGGPLYNSVYCPRGRIKSMQGESLENYTRRYFTTNNCSIGSSGLPFEEVLKLAELVELPRCDRPLPCVCLMPSFPRGGFEYYDHGAGSDTYMAFAVPSCGTCDLTYLLIHAIIATSCGTGSMQVGAHIFDRTPQPPLGNLVHDIFTEYKAFNISYRETGLFGILARTRPESARAVAFAAGQFLSNIGCLSCNEIEIGKRRLKLNLALHDDECIRVSEGLALQIANDLRFDSAKDAISMIDNIRADDVISAAKCLGDKRSLMAMAVVGDVGAAPNIGEVLCGM